MHKVAVIGSPGSADVFRALGAEVYSAASAEETETLLDRVQDEYAVIFITEDVAPAEEALIRRNLERDLPALTLLPVASGSRMGLAKLRHNMEKAVGADILGLGGR